MPNKKNQYMTNSHNLLLIAPKQAVLSSGWEFQENANSDMAAILGTAGGGLQTQRRKL